MSNTISPFSHSLSLLFKAHRGFNLHAPYWLVLNFHGAASGHGPVHFLISSCLFSAVLVLYVV